MFATCDPEYYGQQQALFLDFLEAGLVYRKNAVVNWDPVDMTVLANEQVIDGKGWRSGAEVERQRADPMVLQDLAIWRMSSRTALAGLEDWPAKVRLMQENWIGTVARFAVQLRTHGRGRGDRGLYDTRPDTLMGASFVGISPDHPIAKELAASNPDVQAFREACNKGGTTAEALEKAEKLGFDTGLKVQTSA